MRSPPLPRPDLLSYVQSGYDAFKMGLGVFFWIDFELKKWKKLGILMKGGKDEGKAKEPLFPRLHVTDREKEGPRAPPRNKMALYEKLSIPSKRFNSPSASTSTSAPPQNKAGSSAQPPSKI